MSTALKNVNRKVTDQKTKAKESQVVNSAGGYVFRVSDKSRLERFLILGTDGGTYYANEKEITQANAEFVINLIKSDEDLVRNTVLEVSSEGRAYRNSPAIFTIALLLTEGRDKAKTRFIFDKVVRTSTHLFEFAQYIENLGGWGRAKRSAVADWYQLKQVEDIAYQLIKYRQRDGWTHRDLFRLAHPTGVNPEVAKFALGKEHGEVPDIITGFETMQRADSLKNVLLILDQHKGLPWETIPTDFLKEADVWKALFYNNQLNGQALIRNVTRLAKNGAFDDMKFAADYATRLTDVEMIKRTKLHPINYLNAVVTYQTGQVDRKGGYGAGYRNSPTWKTSGPIVDALNDGFHLAFKTVEPAGKRTFIAIDVSGSMSSLALGIDLSCAQVSGAVAMTIARTEPANIIRGFTSGGYNGNGLYHRNSGLTDLGITAKTSLTDAMNKVQLANWGGTDCSLPIMYAKDNNIEVETFVIITDNDTWAGNIHPFQALKQYRDKTGIDAKMAVLGVSATEFTVADPSSPETMMDFVGFDSAAPKVLADFSGGRL